MIFYTCLQNYMHAQTMYGLLICFPSHHDMSFWQRCQLLSSWAWMKSYAFCCHPSNGPWPCGSMSACMVRTTAANAVQSWASHAWAAQTSLYFQPVPRFGRGAACHDCDGGYAGGLGPYLALDNGAPGGGMGGGMGPRMHGLALAGGGGGTTMGLALSDLDAGP